MARIEGTAGDDRIKGKEGPRNVIHGLEGDDTLFGGDNKDHLVGGAGDDRIYGAAGNDVLSGGHGRDRFLYTSVADTMTFSPDTIRDFEQGKDKILLHGEFEDTNTLHFIGNEGFSGDPGEVRFKTGGGVKARCK